MNKADKEILRRAYGCRDIRQEFRQFSPVTQRKVDFLEYIENIHRESRRDEELSLDDMIEIMNWALERDLNGGDEALRLAYDVFWRPQVRNLSDESPEDKSFFAKYLQQLSEKGWKDENIETIEIQTRNLIRRTTEFAAQSPDKLCSALVVGHVQSGKTSNYCADINYWLTEAMNCTGVGYNTFVVLTDNNSSLGVQTQMRLKKDIIPIKEWSEEFVFDDELGPTVENDTAHARKHGGFIVIDENDEIYRNQECNDRLTYDDARNMFFTPILQENNGKRCLVHTAIKNSRQIKRFTDVIFAQNSPYCDNIHGVVIIDDEADIITPTITARGNDGAVRRRILQLITKFQEKSIPVAYIAFTATPYANILNIPPSDEKNPLFPHIIQILDTPAEYFGTAEILGNAGDPPKWIHKLPNDEKPVANGELSNDLKRAVAWFLCTVAARRIKGSDDENIHPVSMMIHASNLTAKSKEIIKKVKEYVHQDNKSAVLDLCRSVWNLKNNVTPLDLPPNYPGRIAAEPYDLSFDDLREEIENLLVENSSDNNKTFTKGLNFRLLIGKSGKQATFHYPVTDDEKADSGSYPAFIIVGGNCISRGLTLEGLTSVYFVRNTQYSDTLLQFARWNGYRHGYEILPRIWIKEDLIELFREAAYMENYTRRKLKEQFSRNTDHWVSGVRVYGLPNAGLMPTGRMRAASIRRNNSLNYDSNVVPNDPETWESSVSKTAGFVADLGAVPEKNCDGNYLWEGVDGETALTYLKDMSGFYPRSESLNSLLLNEEKLRDDKIKWNVAFIPLQIEGDKTPSPAREDFGFFAGKPMRTGKHESRHNGQSFGSKHVHAGFKDYVADIPGAGRSGMTKQMITDALKENNKENDVLILLYLYETDESWDGIRNEDKGKPIILLSVRWICNDRHLIYSIELGTEDVQEDVDIAAEEQSEDSHADAKNRVEEHTYTLDFPESDEENVVDPTALDVHCNFTIDDNGEYVCTQINADSTLDDRAKEYLQVQGYELQIGEEKKLLAAVKLNNIPANDLARGLTGKDPDQDKVWWCDSNDENLKLVQG